MYPSRIYDILMYGGALAIVLFIILIVALFVLLIKANRMINTGKQAIQTVTHSIMVPFLSLATMIAPLVRGETKTSKVSRTK